MTRQEFQAAYVLGQRITSDGVTTSLAQEVRKGRLVMVHELATTTPAEVHRLTILLGQLSKRDASQVLASLEVDDEKVIVTRFLLGFTSLREWMERAVAESSTFVADTKENPPTMDLAIHDVPRRYTPTEQEAITPSLQDTSIGMPGDRTPPSTPAAKDDVIIKAPRSTEPGGEPGFTELFGALDPSGNRPPPPPASAPATRPPPSLSAGQDPGDSDETGGFTRLFGEDASMPPRQAVPAQSLPTPPPVAAEPTAPPAKAPVIPTPTPTPTARRAEDRVLEDEARDPATSGFTQLFGDSRDRGIVSASEDALPRISPPGLPSAPPATPAAPSVSDRGAAPGPPRLNLSALEGAPSAGRPPSPHGAGHPAGHAPGSGIPLTPLPLSVPARPSDRGPSPDVFGERALPERNVAPSFGSPGVPPASGSYTEVLTPARPPLAPAPPRPTPAQALPPPAPPRPSLAPLIIILTVLLLLAVAIVIVFAWRRR